MDRFIYDSLNNRGIGIVGYVHSMFLNVIWPENSVIIEVPNKRTKVDLKKQVKDCSRKSYETTKQIAALAGLFGWVSESIAIEPIP